jgi:hypothetical protein
MAGQLLAFGEIITAELLRMNEAIDKLTATQAQHAATLAHLTAFAQQIARKANSSAADDDSLTPVPRDDGQLPPMWPEGFDADALLHKPVAAVDALLTFYHLGTSGPHKERRKRLAEYLGIR